MNEIQKKKVGMYWHPPHDTAVRHETIGVSHDITSAARFDSADGSCCRLFAWETAELNVEESPVFKTDHIATVEDLLVLRARGLYEDLTDYVPPDEVTQLAVEDTLDVLAHFVSTFELRREVMVV